MANSRRSIGGYRPKGFAEQPRSGATSWFGGRRGWLTLLICLLVLLLAIGLVLYWLHGKRGPTGPTGPTGPEATYSADSDCLTKIVSAHAEHKTVSKSSQLGRNSGDNWYHDGYSSYDASCAARVIGSLHVVDKESSHVKYSRAAQFGKDWDFPQLSGTCSTLDYLRQEALSDVKMKNKCEVESGTMPYDPYTGATNIHWTVSNYSTLQGDHIVPLGAVWQLGGEAWGTSEEVGKPLPGVPLDGVERRHSIANDLLNIELANGPENQSKSDSPISQWDVPKNKAFRCEYTARYILVSAKYNVYITKADINAAQSILEKC